MHARRRHAAGNGDGQRRVAGHRHHRRRASRPTTTSRRWRRFPNARDMWSLLATTPSVTLNRVDVGGSTVGTQTTYFAYGYSGQNRPLDRGHQHHRRHRRRPGFYLDYGSFEEVFIGAAANSAEMPNPGVLTQFVGKSGGNQLRRQPLLRLRERATSRAATSTPIRFLTPGEPQRRAPSAPTATASPATRTSTSASAARSSRIAIWGHFAYLNQQNSVAAPPAGVVPRRHAVRHQAVQLHRQGAPTS